jgi:hypothetical protein
MYSQSRRGEFDEFLFASIDDDRSEMPLSVLSALARLDVDPWNEAAALSQMPRHCATQRLGSLIDALPDTSARLDVDAISGRLIALLPPPHDSDDWFRPRLHGVGFLTTSQIVKNVIVMVFIFLSLNTWYQIVRRRRRLTDLICLSSALSLLGDKSGGATLRRCGRIAAKRGANAVAAREPGQWETVLYGL